MPVEPPRMTEKGFGPFRIPIDPTAPLKAVDPVPAEYSLVDYVSKMQDMEDNDANG